MAVLSTQFPFLLMPPEIRDMVYKLSLTPQDSDDAVLSESPGKTITIGLIRTSRQVYHESVDILYTNTFSLGATAFNCGKLQRSTWVQNIGLNLFKPQRWAFCLTYKYEPEGQGHPYGQLFYKAGQEQLDAWPIFQLLVGEMTTWKPDLAVDLRIEIFTCPAGIEKDDYLSKVAVWFVLLQYKWQLPNIRIRFCTGDQKDDEKLIRFAKEMSFTRFWLLLAIDNTRTGLTFAEMLVDEASEEMEE